MTEILEGLGGLLLLAFTIALILSLFAFLIAIPFVVIGWVLGSITWAFCLIAPVC